ncbi:MAG: hypothetical protein HRU14_16895 [Planctomycetes bacterium]|nr:hypothetical protein [Planctomycetota bacterium]
MPYETYKLLHVVGLLLLFLGMGGQLLGADSERGRAPRGTAILHAVGLLVMLVGGFGMMARLGIQWPWPGWLIAKRGVWLTIGALPVVVRRQLIPHGLAWLVAVVLGGLAAWLAISKPF